MPKLTLGSLFDGSGGFPLGGLLCGIEPLWASEIEPFPIRVTTKRIPQMQHYGNISALNGADLPPVDIITFGSPCTDMSVAGRRAGLDGKQSVLFYEAIRIIREMREKTNGKYPRYCIWENVPGAFSSNQGADFKAVLDALFQVIEPTAEVPAPDNGKWPYADCYMGDGYSIAYRTIDAQYFGVPQRRRRIYLVADFAGGCAFDILFERKGVSRDFAPCFVTRQGTAGTAADGTGTAGNRVTYSNVQSAGFCTEHSANSRSIGYAEETAPTLRTGTVPGVAIENHPTDGRCKVSEDGLVQTLTSRMGTGGMNVPLVMNAPKTLKIRSGCDGGGKGALVQDDLSATLSCHNNQTIFVPTAYGICSDKSNSMQSSNPNSGIYEAETARTLDANGGNPGCNQGGIAVVALQGSMIGRKDNNGPQGCGMDEEVSFTLNTVDHHAVAYAMTVGGYTEVHEEKAATLMARDYKDPQIVKPVTDYIVRRLTPTECARLQGFPDGWCDDLGTENSTEEELAFWSKVWETHRRILGKSRKPKTRNQLLKWLRDPYSDAAAYKMWGNGVALPCVCFVLMGIVQAETENEDGD